MSEGEDNSEVRESVWCIVANIVEKPLCDSEGNDLGRTGTRQFSSGTKMYLTSMGAYRTLLGDRPQDDPHVEVIGRDRRTKRFVKKFIKPKLLTDLRIKLECHPMVVARLREVGWEGFNIIPGRFTPPDDRKSRAALEELAYWASGGSLGRRYPEPATSPEWGRHGDCPKCGFSYRWDGAACRHCGHGLDDIADANP